MQGEKEAGLGRGRGKKFRISALADEEKFFQARERVLRGRGKKLPFGLDAKRVFTREKTERIRAVRPTAKWELHRKKSPEKRKVGTRRDSTQGA